MKQKIAGILAFLLGMTSFGNFLPVAAAEAKTAYLYINENKVVKTIQPEMYGINFEWGAGNEGHESLLPGSTEIDPSYVQALDGVLPMARAAGMSANRLFWKGAIGDYEDRTLQKFWWRNPMKQYFGPVEWFKGSLAVNPDVKFIYTVNLYDTQENIADLVEFLRGDGTVNYNGGINWAERRKELGLEEPINIMAFELANEIDAGSEGAWNAARYTEACKKTIQTIRSVDPEAKIAVMKKTSGGDDWSNWHKSLLRECGDEIDYIAAHIYSLYENTGKMIRNQGEVIMNDVINITGDDRIKIIYTEHAMRPLDQENVGTRNYNSPHSMMGVLATSEWYLRIGSYPHIVAASYHAIQSANWAVIYKYQGKVARTAIGDLLRMCTKYFVGDNLEVTQSDMVFDIIEENDVNDLAGAAVKTEDGINLFLINQTEQEGTFNFTFSDKAYKAVKMSQITAPELLYDNYEARQEITVIEDQAIDTGYLKEYKVPKYSVTVLNLVECEKDESAELQGSVATVKTFALGNTNAIVDGGSSKFTKAPKMINDRFYVPVETVEALLGAESVLSADSKEVTLTSATDKYIFRTDDSLYYKNDISVKTDAPAVYDEDGIYLPLRVIADDLGDKTYWDNRGFVVLRNNIFPDMDATKDKNMLDYLNNWFSDKGGIK